MRMTIMALLTESWRPRARGDEIGRSVGLNGYYILEYSEIYSFASLLGL
jgi:hypothetical protein